MTPAEEKNARARCRRRPQRLARHVVHYPIDALDLIAGVRRRPGLLMGLDYARRL